MSDKPTVGTFGEPEEEGVEGVVLYRPARRPEHDLADQIPVPDEPPAHRGLAVTLSIVAVLSVVGAYVIVSGLPGSAADPDATAALPEMIPSEVESNRSAEALRVLTERPRGEVGSVVSVGVRATGPGGVALPDTLVHFRVARGDAVLMTPESRADTEGVARTSVMLPATPGTTIVVASVQGASIPEAQIEVTALPGAPSRIVAVAGGGQSGQAGELLSERVIVRVTDAADNPVPGVPISFRVRSGDGVAAPSLRPTDSLGISSALWRLGLAEGAQALVATSSALASEVTFSATATARPTVTQMGPSSTGIETGPVSVRGESFVIGASHICFLSGAVAECRGSNDRGQAALGATGRFVALATGIFHTCGLDREGTAYCWGANDGGQLGDATRADRPSPVPVRTELKFSFLTAGASHTCGLAGGGVPVCWGLNLSGQLGDGSRTDQRGPRTVGGGLEFRSLTAGWNHTCGLTQNGNAFCWGANNQGQLGDGSRLDRLVPTMVRGSVERLVAGSTHTCGIAEGRALCWGGNAAGQLGDGTTEDRSQPTPVVGLPGAPTMLAAGGVHACALVGGGRAYCWGMNREGQLGDGTTQNRSSATAVAGDLTFASIHAGGAVTCGVTTGGAQYCWGLNQSGQLGDGSRASRNVPTRVGG